jgi:hypothetical protein
MAMTIICAAILEVGDRRPVIVSYQVDQRQS